MPLILIGGGGHCRACIDVIESTGKWEIKGILDDSIRIGELVLGYPVIGTDNSIASAAADDFYFLVTIGQIKTPAARRNLHDKVKLAGGRLATIVSPHAYIASSSKIGEGTIVMHRALINSGASIGKHCIVNTMALIEHDAIIGNDCHISTAAVVNGGAKVSDGSFLGSNAVIVHGALVPKESFIPAASLYRGIDQ